MDEYNSGMDPAVKKYFRKIIKSFCAGLLWMMATATAGLYFNLGEINAAVKWYNILFYAITVAGFAALLVYYYKIWSKP